MIVYILMKFYFTHIKIISKRQSIINRQSHFRRRKFPDPDSLNQTECSETVSRYKSCKINKSRILNTVLKDHTVLTIIKMYSATVISYVSRSLVLPTKRLGGWPKAQYIKNWLLESLTAYCIKIEHKTEHSQTFMTS